MVHITDLPLEVFEIVLIIGLGLGLYMQNQTRREDKRQAEKRLTESQEELRHLRRMLDRILLVEKGYARPGEDLEEEELQSRRH